MQEQQHKLTDKLPHLLFPGAKKLTPIEKIWSILTFSLGTLSLFFVIAMADSPVQRFISPVMRSLALLQPWFNHEKSYQTFSFAPGGSERKFDLIDYDGLDTLAYFDLPLNADGTIDQDNDAYQTLKSEVGTTLFTTAHQHGTKVVLTLTQTNNSYIASFLNNPAAQEESIIEAIREVKDTGADGVVLDFEFTGGAGEAYKTAYTHYVSEFVEKMHNNIPASKINIAISTADTNQALYDMSALAQTADQVFVMAYTFAVPEEKANTAAAPVYGYDAQAYWKDVDTSVLTYSKQISEDKFVMERAWYGNGDRYPFYQSFVKRSGNTQQSSSDNTMRTPLSKATINGLVAQVPTSARPAARKNLPLIAKALEEEGILNANVLAYALATIEHETASTFEPIEEIRGRKSARRLGYEGGTNYFGRGFIQLTHVRNYKMMGERIGMGDRLAQHPELASDAMVAAKVLAAFFKDNGVARLATNGYFVAARRPINPDYEGNWIANLAWKYLEMIG
jgi:predicted chitinase